jgi:hypothetical protein
MKVWKIFSHSNVTVFRIVQLQHQINVSINDENRFKQCSIAVPWQAFFQKFFNPERATSARRAGASAYLHEKISGKVEN